MDSDDTNRSQILADFQACTNIEDIGHALAVLDEANWDITLAINRVLQGDDDEDPFERNIGSGIIGRGLDVTGSFEAYSSSPPRQYPATSEVREIVDELGVSRRLINFHVSYNEDQFDIQVDDSKSLADLKTRLAQWAGCQNKDVTIVWNDKRISAEDTTILRQLHLPRENVIALMVNLHPPPDMYSMPPENVAYVTLSIDVKDHGAIQNRELRLPGSKTVIEVKQDMFTLTSIPVSRQSWSGWPLRVSDGQTLLSCCLDRPVHKFTLSRTQTCGDDQPQPSPIIIDSDSDTDNCDLDDDDMEIALETRSSRRNLIPRDVTDPALALTHFNEEFARRYGNTTRLVFFVGSLAQAVQEALLVSAENRRPLAIYLHHDDSITANVFCSQVMCSETIVSYLSTNFLSWAWDLTLFENKERFMQACLAVLGSAALEVVRRLPIEQLPMLLIMTKVRGGFEIVVSQPATTSVDELMNSLLHADEVFQQQKSQEIIEEQERLEREEMKMMQDAAYEESLAADRVKAEQKQMEQMELNRQQEDLKRAQLEQMLEESEKEAIKKTIASTIPDEPPDNCPEPVARLRMRFPGGETISRRFLGKLPLRVLLDFLMSRGYSSDRFKVLTTFPRRDLTVENSEDSLDALRLCPQETLTLEEKV